MNETQKIILFFIIFLTIGGAISYFVLYHKAKIEVRERELKCQNLGLALSNIKGNLSDAELYRLGVNPSQIEEVKKELANMSLSCECHYYLFEAGKFEKYTEPHCVCDCNVTDLKTGVNSSVRVGILLAKK